VEKSAVSMTSSIYSFQDSGAFILISRGFSWEKYPQSLISVRITGFLLGRATNLIACLAFIGNNRIRETLAKSIWPGRTDGSSGEQRALASKDIFPCSQYVDFSVSSLCAHLRDLA
jgi:hypothetical protein